MYEEQMFYYCSIYRFSVIFWLILCKQIYKVKCSGHASADKLILNENNMLSFLSK